MKHHMSDWEERELPNGIKGRVCEHGLVHPDPQDLQEKAHHNFAKNITLADHECDGCCVDLDPNETGDWA